MEGKNELEKRQILYYVIAAGPHFFAFLLGKGPTIKFPELVNPLLLLVLTARMYYCWWNYSIWIAKNNYFEHFFILMRKVDLSLGPIIYLLTSFMADLRQDINRVSSFSRCLNGTLPWSNCSVKTLVHSSKWEEFTYQSLNRHMLQGKVSLRHLLKLNAKPLFMSWQSSAFNEVNDWALYKEAQKFFKQ